MKLKILVTLLILNLNIIGFAKQYNAKQILNSVFDEEKEIIKTEVTVTPSTDVPTIIAEIKSTGTTNYHLLVSSLTASDVQSAEWVYLNFQNLGPDDIWTTTGSSETIRDVGTKIYATQSLSVGTEYDGVFWFQVEDGGDDSELAVSGYIK